jgi:hypothetical protein
MSRNKVKALVNSLFIGDDLGPPPETQIYDVRRVWSIRGNL